MGVRVGKPLVRDLHVGERVEIVHGPLAPRVGLLHEIRERTLLIRLTALQRRDVVVEVPIPFCAEVGEDWLKAELAKKPDPGDPYAYLTRQIQKLRNEGVDYFRCRDPYEWDVQIAKNWIWFSGQAEQDRIEQAGSSVHFAANVFAIKTPVLLVHRATLFGRILVPSKNPNIAYAEGWLEGLPKRIKKQVSKPQTCYRGYVYRPSDIWQPARNPRRGMNYYRFARGRLMPGNVQFVAVPELGVTVEHRLAKRKGLQLVMRPVCYALPLLPVSILKLVRLTRWGIFSTATPTSGRRIDTPFDISPDVTEQVSSLSGGE